MSKILFLWCSRRPLFPLLVIIFTIASSGCSNEEEGGTHFYFRVSESSQDIDFYDIPFPNDLRLKEDGNLDLSNFPNPDQVSILSNYLDIIATNTRGFGTNAAIFFRFTAPLDEGSLPQEPAETITFDSPVFLVNIDINSLNRGTRIPLQIRFQEKGMIYQPENILTALPVYGFPLEPATTYAVVITNRVKDKGGSNIQSPVEFKRVKNELPCGNARTAEAIEIYRPLFDFLKDEGKVNKKDVAAATVFTTQDPVGDMFKIRDFIYEDTSPIPAGMEYKEQSDNCYIIEGEYPSPQFQDGEPPFSEKGQLMFDDNGQPVVREYEQLRFALCVPKGSQPAEGWPILTYAHGTGGDYRTFVDNNDVADYLGSLGIASISIDQPLHGERLGGGGDPEMDFYNFLNPLAGRDNPRQSAIDSLVLNRMAPGIVIGTDICPPCVDASFDPEKVLFMGHSQGAHTGGLFLGVEPDVKGAVLSGAGGGLAITMLTKTDPYDVKDMIEGLLGIGGEEELDFYHPIINLIQTYIEPADPLNYAPYYLLDPLFGIPKNIFISEGFKDTQVTPLTAEAFATAIGANPIEPVYQSILGLTLRGLKPLTPPVNGNIGPNGVATAGILQYPEGDHWVLTRDAKAKAQWGRFLQSLVEDGLATIEGYEP